MSDFGVSVRALPNAVGLLHDAYVKYCDTFTDEAKAELKAQVENVFKWASELRTEFEKDII